MDKEKLREKIYSMSNSYLPLDMFFNDIEHIRVLDYNKNLAFSDLEKIADFIIDLEAKLAESEDKNKKLKDEVRKSNVGIAHLKNQLKQAKEKLAEKEKEIETLQHYNDRLAQGIYHSYGEHFVSKIRQDKISFAVERLVDVQKYIDDNAVFVEEECFGREINCYIDSLIKELRGEK